MAQRTGRDEKPDHRCQDGSGGGGGDDDLGVVHVFVYGTLRRDCTPEAPWTRTFNTGTLSRPATISGARLFCDAYPVIKFSGQASDKVIGMVVGTVDADDWPAKLKEADAIEGYPHYYQRKVVTAELIEEPGVCVRAYAYYRDNASEDSPVPGNDWLNYAP